MVTADPAAIVAHAATAVAAVAVMTEARAVTAAAEVVTTEVPAAKAEIAAPAASVPRAVRRRKRAQPPNSPRPSSTATKTKPQVTNKNPAAPVRSGVFFCLVADDSGR